MLIEIAEQILSKYWGRCNQFYSQFLHYGQWRENVLSVIRVFFPWKPIGAFRQKVKATESPPLGRNIRCQIFRTFFPTRYFNAWHRSLYLLLGAFSVNCSFSVGLFTCWRASVSTRLSEHLIVIGHLNKFESASISIRKQTKNYNMYK